MSAPRSAGNPRITPRIFSMCESAQAPGAFSGIRLKDRIQNILFKRIANKASAGPGIKITPLVGIPDFCYDRPKLPRKYAFGEERPPCPNQRFPLHEVEQFMQFHLVDSTTVPFLISGTVQPSYGDSIHHYDPFMTYIIAYCSKTPSVFTTALRGFVDLNPLAYQLSPTLGSPDSLFQSTLTLTVTRRHFFALLSSVSPAA